MRTPLLFLLLATMTLLPRHGYATKTVTSPSVEEGKLGLEWKGGYDIDDRNSVNGGWQQKAAVNYGITPSWSSETEATFRKRGARGSEADLTSIAWKNKLQLTKQDNTWLDTGIRLTTDFNMKDGPHNAEIKILMARNTGRFRHTANIVAEREFGENAGNDTGFGLSWNSRYRWIPEFEPGFEIHSDFGPLNDGSDFNEENHQAGLVAYGKLGALGYDAGYLFGLSDAATDGQIKAILKYGIKF